MSEGSSIMDTMRCDHEHIVCPNHEGSFDCHSFCSICEGNQEFCPEGCVMTLDENDYLIYVKETNE